MDSTKVFIDTDNEITFILEKVLSAKSDRVSLVVPDRASLFSSITGLKLIKRVIDKSNKLLVIVTLDEQGADLSTNAGLMVVSRVGEINEGVWERALKEKFEVRKRDTRSHYMPDNVSTSGSEGSSENEVTLAELVDVAHHDLETAGRAIDEKHIEMPEPEEPELSEQNLPEEQSVEQITEFPQVRISIDEAELQQADEEFPENVETEQVIEMPAAPSFLTRETPTSAKLTPIDADDAHSMTNIEEHIEEPAKGPDAAPLGTIKSSQTQDANEELQIRIRKESSSRPGGISNLTFVVGKDIQNEKKK